MDTIGPFEAQELKELLLSAGVITLLFAYPPRLTAGWVGEFAFYFLLVGFGFAVHESAHKFTAKSLGAWSEFHMWTEGLMFALLMRVIGGPVFVAPGATYWHKPFATEEDQGKVSVAGPVSNLLLALLFIAGALVNPMLGLGARINLQLAMFNLLPIPPMDGSKVIRWNAALWVVLLSASILGQAIVPGA